MTSALIIVGSHMNDTENPFVWANPVSVYVLYVWTCHMTSWITDGPLHATNFQHYFTWSSPQGGNSYEEMKKKLSDATSLSQVTVVSDWH